MAKKAANPWRKKLDALAAKLGYTHAQLAAEIGVARITLRNWLYGATTPTLPAQKLINRLCKENGIGK